MLTDEDKKWFKTTLVEEVIEAVKAFLDDYAKRSHRPETAKD